MKILLLIVIGSLGGLDGVVAFVQLIRTLMVSKPETASGGSSIAASVVPVCLGQVVCLVCLQRRFASRRQSENPGSIPLPVGLATAGPAHRPGSDASPGWPGAAGGKPGPASFHSLLCSWLPRERGVY